MRPPRAHAALVVVALAALAACKVAREAPPAPTGSATAAPAAPVAAPPAAPGAIVDAGRSCDPARGPVCDFHDVTECTPAGTLGRVLEACRGSCRDGRCLSACEVEGVKLAYLFDSAGRLLRFDPRKLPDDAAFTPVGTLRCGGAGASPNAMAIDRAGIAWLSYTPGHLYTAAITDAACTARDRLPTDAPRTFAMTFAGDVEGGETLYVVSLEPPYTLGVIDTRAEPPRYRELEVLPPTRRPPDITGLPDGALYGYVPGPGLGFVQRIDVATGQLVGPRLSLGGAGTEQVGAWTFLHWAGVFYLFVELEDGQRLFALDRATGKVTLVRDRLPFVAVGAGASPCAPMLERP